jgi:hypothetical protein
MLNNDPAFESWAKDAVDKELPWGNWRKLEDEPPWQVRGEKEREKSIESFVGRQ